MRDRRFEIRFSETELKELKHKAKATGLSISELIRQATKRVKTWTVADRKTEHEKIIQIAKVGNNLNQIARWCNRYKNTTDSIDVIKHLIIIERELKKL